MWKKEKSINFNKSKHSTLQLFARLQLDYIPEYHDIREGIFSKEQIVDKLKISHDDVTIILKSLMADEEIKFQSLGNEYDFSGYVTTNKGVKSFEDKKYLRLDVERKRATLSFYLSIFAIIISIISMFISRL